MLRGMFPIIKYLHISICILYILEISQNDEKREESMALIIWEKICETFHGYKFYTSKLIILQNYILCDDRILS